MARLMTKLKSLWEKIKFFFSNRCEKCGGKTEQFKAGRLDCLDRECNFKTYYS